MYVFDVYSVDDPEGDWHFSVRLPDLHPSDTELMVAIWQEAGWDCHCSDYPACSELVGGYHDDAAMGTVQKLESAAGTPGGHPVL